MKTDFQDMQHILETLTTKSPTIAFIKEEACIGCFKCVNACPVDAIVGTPQRMHTVLSTQCIGCDLCINACPVNCIAAIPSTLAPDLDLALSHYEKKQKRLSTLSAYEKTLYFEHTFQTSDDPLSQKKAAIAAAVQRANHKNR